MKSKSVLLIANALLWAGLMLAGSYFFKGHPWGEHVIFVGIFGYVLVNGFLVTKGSRKC